MADNNKITNSNNNYTEQKLNCKPHNKNIE